MNIYQKIFGYIIVIVTFGAGAFHTIATFSPVILDILDNYPIISNTIMLFIISSLFTTIFMMWKSNDND